MFGFLKRGSAERRNHENILFKEKYLHFRELLDRNHEVLGAISKLADVKEHEKRISVAGIRSKIIHIAVNVYKLI